MVAFSKHFFLEEENYFIFQYLGDIYKKIFKTDTMSAFCVAKQIIITSILQPCKMQSRFHTTYQKEHFASWIQFWSSELKPKQMVLVPHDSSHSL